MSDKRSFYAHSTHIALKLAAQLAREDKGFYKPLTQVADDVQAIMRAGEDARKALSEHRSPAAAFAKAAKVARTYNAEVVQSEDVNGSVLGLRFSSGRFGKPGAVFFVS